MRDQDYKVSLDFLSRLFVATTEAIELRACPNDRGSAGAASQITTSDESRLAFLARKDAPGMGSYFGVCTRHPNTETGNKASVRECPALWVDIDCVKQGIHGQDAIDALNFLPIPPSIIVNSGAGLHAYWVMEEPEDVSGGSYEGIEELLKQLVYICAGDRSVAEIARIMRLPGTLNSKETTLAINDNAPALVEIVSDTGRVYGLSDLAEWIAEQRPILQSKTQKEFKDAPQQDPFLRHAKEYGYVPALDIESEIAAIDPGDGVHGIHPTCLRVSMSMIARGHDDDEIVDFLLAAVAPYADPRKPWNWRAEEKKLRGMIRSGRELARTKPKPGSMPLRIDGNAALKLVHSAEPEAEPEESPAPKGKESKSQTVAIGKAAIGVWKERYGPVMHTGGLTYAYEGGVWSVWDERLAQRLRAIIQEACASLRVEPKTSLLGAAKAYFMDRPELIRDAVRFDEHGLLIAQDACLDLRTFEIMPHSPEHFATRKAAATLAGSRDRTELEAFLGNAFSDKDPVVAKGIIATLQEWFGAAIMALPMKQRGQKKGLFGHGPSRSGKTQLSELARFLLGHDHVCGTPMRGLEDRFGTEPLIGKYGWIADDAVSEGEYLDADIYKVVVTGEQTSTRTKGGKNWEGRFGIPVLLTANNLPKVKDQSDAVYNRLLIVPMTNVRPENAPEPAGFESIADLIGKTELTGLLWWAIEGWQRLAQRGVFDPPAIMLEASKALKDDNNPVDAWRRECLEIVPDSKVLRADLLASMNGWSSQEYGADAKPWAGRSFFPKLTKMLPGYSKEKSEAMDLDGNRALCGVRLNKSGLLAWRVYADSRWGQQSSSCSSSEALVNRDHYPGRIGSQPSDKRTVF